MEVRLNVKKIGIIFVIISLLIIITTLIDVATKTNDTTRFKRDEELAEYSMNWVIDSCDITEKTVDLPKKISTKCDTVTISKKVDNAMMLYKAIAFETTSQIASVYVNDELVYSFHNERRLQFSNIGTDMWHFVDLDGKIMLGDEIKIEIGNVTHIVINSEKRGEFIKDITAFDDAVAEKYGEFLKYRDNLSPVNLSRVYLCSREGLFSLLFGREITSLYISITLMMTGFVATIFGFLPYRSVKNLGNLKYLGIGMIFMSFTIILESAVTKFIVTDISYLDFLSRVIKLVAEICVAFYFYHGKIFKRDYIIKVEIGIVAIALYMKVILYITGFGSVIDFFVSERAVIIFFIAINTVILCFEYIEKRIKSEKKFDFDEKYDEDTEKIGLLESQDTSGVIVAMLLFLIFFGISAISRLRLGGYSSHYESIALILFAFVLGLRELRSYSHLYEEGRSVEKYRELAGKDTLTGLKNRTSFLENLPNYKLQYENLTVVSCDVDNLKETNDELGHSTGDELLRTVARIMDRTLSKIGGTSYRMSGDEFLCVLKNVERNAVENAVKSIKEQMNRKTSEKGFKVSASCGIAYFEKGQDDSFEKLMERADASLYEDKNLGKE